MSLFDAPPVAVTIGNTVFIPAPQTFLQFPERERASLLAHEFTHVYQWQKLGTIGFLREYISEYLRTRREGGNTHDPTQGISLEREAIKIQLEVYTRLQEQNKK